MPFYTEKNPWNGKWSPSLKTLATRYYSECQRLVFDIQALAASGMSSSGSFPLGSLLATRTQIEVQPFKIAGSFD